MQYLNIHFVYTTGGGEEINIKTKIVCSSFIGLSCINMPNGAGPKELSISRLVSDGSWAPGLCVGYGF